MQAVVQVDDAVAAVGDGGVVGDHHDRPARRHQLVEQLQDRLARLAVEVPGGLVGQQDERVVDQRPGDAHALLLPAGQLHGAVVERGRLRPDPLGQLHRAAAALGGGMPR